jgi:hypothetical protein
MDMRTSDTLEESSRMLEESFARFLEQEYGFPRWEGGPVFWARQQERAALERDLQTLAAESGHGFVVADLSVLLD